MQKSKQNYVLITGATSGVGRALACEFARHEHPLVLVAEDGALLRELINEVSKISSCDIVTHILDITKESATDELFDELHRKNINVHTLVNNMGVGFRSDFVHAPMGKIIEIIRREIEVLSRLTELLLQGMIERGEGRIMNVGSVAGYQPGPLMAVYHASKAYVRSLTESLLEELKGTNVTVSCLAPDPLDTFSVEEGDTTDSLGADRAFLMGPREVASVAYEGLMQPMHVSERYVPVLA